MNQCHTQRWLAGSLVSILLSACSGSAPRPAAPTAMPSTPLVQGRIQPSTVATRPQALGNSASLVDDSEGDCLFLNNAARAITEYQSFIALAGPASEYAGAVRRSREQITDLEAEMEFVRAGMQQRGAHCIADRSGGTPQIALE